MRHSLTILLAALAAFAQPTVAHATPPYEPPVCIVRTTTFVAKVNHRNVLTGVLRGRLVSTSGSIRVKPSFDVSRGPYEPLDIVRDLPARTVRPGAFTITFRQQLPRRWHGTRIIVRVLGDTPRPCNRILRVTATRTPA